MKARRFDEILRARGYKVVSQTKYDGLNMYIKKHKYNSSYCYVEKDTHGKAQSMNFNITNNNLPQNMDEFKEAEFDRGYLAKEAEKIHEAFEQLKVLKSPKHIYCF